MQTRHIATLLTLALAASLTHSASAQEKPQLPFTISPETTAIVSPLKTNGAINYIQALNEKYGKGVTPDNNGFIPWLEIVERKSDLSPEERAQAFKLLGTKDNLNTKEPVPRFLHFHDYLAQVEKMDFKAPPEKDDGNASSQQTPPFPGQWSNSQPLNAAQLADKELYKATLKPWNPKDFPHVAAYLAHEQKNLDLAHIPVALPRWWSPYVGDSLLLYLSKKIRTDDGERGISNAWCARAMMRAGAGDFDGFLADIVATRQLARHVGEGPEDMERITAADLDAYACRSAAAFAATGALTADQSRKLAKAMAQFPPPLPAFETVDTLVRWETLEAVQLIALNEKTGSWENELNTFKNIDRQNLDWNLVFKRVNTWYDLQVEAYKKTTDREFLKDMSATYEQVEGWKAALKEKGPAKTDDETREAYSNRIADGIITDLISPLEIAPTTQRLDTLQQQMLQTILAAAEYHALHKKWPASLEDLPPEALKKVPLDPYWKDGAQPVRYAVTEKGIRLYSVGRNGRLDDNGEPRHPISLGIEKESPPPTH